MPFKVHKPLGKTNFVFDESKETAYDEKKGATLKLLRPPIGGSPFLFQFQCEKADFTFAAEYNFAEDKGETIMTCDISQISRLPRKIIGNKAAVQEIKNMVVEALHARKWGQKCDEKGMNFWVDAESFAEYEEVEERLVT